MKKRSTRRPITPLPPRGLRAQLSAAQVRDLSLCHHINLDAIATGQADESTLWQTVGGALTWSRVADLLGLGAPEMAEQLQVLERVVSRYGRTGRVGFSGQEYQLAKHGVAVMDQLAAIVDQPTAIAAADWSEARVEKMAQACAARHAAATEVAA